MLQLEVRSVELYVHIAKLTDSWHENLFQPEDTTSSGSQFSVIPRVWGRRKGGVEV